MITDSKDVDAAALPAGMAFMQIIFVEPYFATPRTHFFEQVSRAVIILVQATTVCVCMCVCLCVSVCVCEGQKKKKKDCVLSVKEIVIADCSEPRHL